MTVAGTATGAAFAAAGAGVHALRDDVIVPLAVVLGAVTLAYALHELELLRVPVPGRDWQVPADWVRDGFYRSAVIFGSVVGFGVFTRIPYASLPILLGWLFVSGNVVLGAAAGLVYAATRALSIYSSATSQTSEELVGLNHRFMAFIPQIHQATGLALATFGAYLLVAPLLP